MEERLVAVSHGMNVAKTVRVLVNVKDRALGNVGGQDHVTVQDVLDAIENKNKERIINQPKRRQTRKINVNNWVLFFFFLVARQHGE